MPGLLVNICCGALIRQQRLVVPRKVLYIYIVISEQTCKAHMHCGTWLWGTCKLSTHWQCVTLAIIMDTVCSYCYSDSGKFGIFTQFTYALCWYQMLSGYSQRLCHRRLDRRQVFGGSMPALDFGDKLT